jgi:hypothetical protein
MWKGETAGEFSRHGADERCVRVLVETSEGKTSLGRFKHRWENIHIDLEDVWCDNVDCINLAQERDDYCAGDTRCEP